MTNASSSKKEPRVKDKAVAGLLSLSGKKSPGHPRQIFSQQRKKAFLKHIQANCPQVLQVVNFPPGMLQYIDNLLRWHVILDNDILLRPRTYKFIPVKVCNILRAEYTRITGVDLPPLADHRWLMPASPSVASAPPPILAVASAALAPSVESAAPTL